jgi:RNA polymerase sigma-70 factor, ECF subfamily
MDLDAEVAQRIADGDLGEAATRTIRALGPGVLGYLRPVLREPDDVEDAFSEWCERVWHGLRSFEFRASLRSWSARLAVNVAINLRNQAHRRRVRRFASGELSAVAASVLTSATGRLDRRQAVRALSEELTAEQQTLLFLRVNQGLSWEEIASILGSEGGRGSPAAVERRYGRLVARLRSAARKRRLLR